jgi:hypothetical protein
MPKKITFDWSSLERKQLIKSLYAIHSKVTKKDISIHEFQKLISKHLKSIVPVIVKKRWDKDIERNAVWVGGTYYRDSDKNCHKCIEIEFFYKINSEKIILSPSGFKRICGVIADTLLHEIIHMRQYRRRNFKILPDYASTAEKTSERQQQEYLGNSDEIDAYGFNIACDLMERFKNDQKQVTNYLNKKRFGHGWNSWRTYLKTFDNNHNHIIIKRLKQKIVRYLPYAELGKPYKNKDWISH